MQPAPEADDSVLSFAASCVSVTPRIAQNQNIPIKELILETSEVGKTSQISLKGFYDLTRWFFRRIDIEYRRSDTETLHFIKFLQLCLTRRDVWGYVTS